jgi:trimeric autotransporter adhesin
VKVSPSATFADEKVSVVNTNGTGDESILLNSAAGGAKFKVANGKNLVLGNSNENLYVKVSPHSTLSSEKLSIVNTNGTGDESILLNSAAGGAKFKVADTKNLVLGNTDEDIYFKVSPNGSTNNEKLSVVNTNGTAADSILINSVSGGLTINGGTTVNLATNNNSGAVNIGTLGDRTITLGVNSGSSKVVIDAVDVILTNGMTASSDIRLKENFEPMSNALELVSQLNGLYYTWKKDAGTDKPRKLGFIAQEVEKVIPELVKTDSEGMKSVDYVSVVPVLVEAIKHQQKQIDELKALLHA